MRSCTVAFDNAAAQRKIKRGEKPTEQEMFNMTSKSNIGAL
jgi:hypothetical protein